MRALKSFVIASAAVILTTACGAQTIQDTKAVHSETTATYLIIEFHVAQDRGDEFLPVMTGINEGMAGEEGFVEAIVYRDSDDGLTFTLIEKWESRALHRAHYDRIVESGAWAGILAMLTEAPALRYNDKL